MFKEDYQNYPAEAKWLNQTPNRCVFYISGRGIVRDDNGKYFFFPLGEISHYQQNEMINGTLLGPVTLLQEHEQAQIKNLDLLKTKLSPLGLHPVRNCTEKNTQQLVFTHEACESTFFQIAMSDIEKLTADTSALLKGCTEERYLDNPYCIQFEENEMLIY